MNTNAAILIDLLAAISRQHSHFGDEKIWKFRQFIYSSERERQVLHILNQTEGYSLDTAVDYIMDLLLSPAEERDQIVDYLNGLIQNEVKENIPSQANG